MVTKRIFLFSLLALGLSLIQGGSTLAQSYPSRAIQLIVPFSGGSATDIAARGFAGGLAAEFGQPVTVINREGASGTIAFAAVASAFPDGYTLLFGSTGQLTIQPHLKPKLSYRVDAFEPICQVWETVFAIVVGPQSPLGSFGDLLNQARAKPKTVTFGTTGTGTAPHLMVEGLARAAGLEIVHVPYRIGGQIKQDVIGGRLDVGVDTIAALGGVDVRFLAILGRERSDGHPNVPSVHEFGYPVATPAFGGLFAPKGVPDTVLRRLEVACRIIFDTPLYQSTVKNSGSMAAFLPRVDFAKRIADDSREKAALIKVLGLTAD